MTTIAGACFLANWPNVCRWRANWLPREDDFAGVYRSARRGDIARRRGLTDRRRRHRQLPGTGIRRFQRDDQLGIGRAVPVVQRQYDQWLRRSQPCPELCWPQQSAVWLPQGGLSIRGGICRRIPKGRLALRILVTSARSNRAGVFVARRHLRLLSREMRPGRRHDDDLIVAAHVKCSEKMLTRPMALSPWINPIPDAFIFRLARHWSDWNWSAIQSGRRPIPTLRTLRHRRPA